jgi:hypothetical protein
MSQKKKNKRRKNQCGELFFKPCVLRITGTDSDGLKCTQERGCADGKTPDNSRYVHDCLTTNIIQKMLYSKG